MAWIVYKRKHAPELLKAKSLNRKIQLKFADSLHTTRKGALSRTRELDSLFSKLIGK